MRQLKRVGVFLLLPFFVLIDAHISQLLGSFFPHVQLASHFLFLFLLFETIEVSEYLYLVYCFVIGLVYDVYFFHLIGIATLLFILLGAFLHKLKPFDGHLLHHTDGHNNGKRGCCTTVHILQGQHLMPHNQKIYRTIKAKSWHQWEDTRCQKYGHWTSSSH